MTPPDALPTLFGTWRRRRLVSAVSGGGGQGPPEAPPHAWTWEAWDTSTGERALLRVVRDAAPIAGLPLPLAFSTEGAPHLRTAPFACSLADLLPFDEPAGPAWTARLALGTFAALAALHEAGRVHGTIGADYVVSVGDSWTLAWLGTRPGTPVEDVRALGRLVGELDPDGPIGALAASFDDTPPPSAADGGRLLLSACTAHLAHERHTLVARARDLGVASRRGRLRSLAARLDGVLAPPAAQGRAGDLAIVSDGRGIVAARAPEDAPSARGFVVLGEAGLDPVGARTVLRAWAAGGEPALAPLMRWVSAAARLRVDRKLLER